MENDPNTAQDTFNTEFIYYSSVLRSAAPSISIDADRQLVTPWIRKLFSPEYQSSKLKEKRNRYLITLTINLLNDDVHGVFRRPPDDAGPLPDLQTLEEESVAAAEWELDTMWQNVLLGLADDFQPLQCPAHQTKDECRADHSIDKVLDQEFQFMVYLARPYAALLEAGDRTRAAAWIHTLCTVHDPACSSLRAIRNDYMMALLGYLQDMRVVGPFLEYPPLRCVLKPLAESVKDIPVTDPTNPQADEFMQNQPMPDDGAFCYIALTGDLVASSFAPDTM